MSFHKKKNTSLSLGLCHEIAMGPPGPLRFLAPSVITEHCEDSWAEHNVIYKASWRLALTAECPSSLKVKEQGPSSHLPPSPSLGTPPSPGDPSLPGDPSFHGDPTLYLTVTAARPLHGGCWMLNMSRFLSILPTVWAKYLEIECFFSTVQWFVLPLHREDPSSQIL